MAIIDGDGDAVTSCCFALLLPFLLLVVESIEVDGVGEGKDGFERKRERKGKKKDATLVEYDDIRVLGNLEPGFIICLLVQAALFPNPILPRISDFIVFVVIIIIIRSSQSASSLDIYIAYIAPHNPPRVQPNPASSPPHPIPSHLVQSSPARETVYRYTSCFC